jgi:hypothetical protein
VALNNEKVEIVSGRGKGGDRGGSRGGFVSDGPMTG